MRLIPPSFVALVALIVTAPAAAQDWKTVNVIDDGFRANYPGDPAVEKISYESEFHFKLPGRVYRAADDFGRYSTTVVDYRHAERLHSERSAKCLAANGANQQDGDTCQNDFIMEVAGAMDHAVGRFLVRDGVKVTHYGAYYIDLVSGRQLQLTNSDRSRTYVAVHQHAGRLYIQEATVPAAPPVPSLRHPTLGSPSLRQRPTAPPLAGLVRLQKLE